MQEYWPWAPEATSQLSARPERWWGHRWQGLLLFCSGTGYYGARSCIKVWLKPKYVILNAHLAHVSRGPEFTPLLGFWDVVVVSSFREHNTSLNNATLIIHLRREISLMASQARLPIIKNIGSSMSHYLMANILAHSLPLQLRQNHQSTDNPPTKNLKLSKPDCDTKTLCWTRTAPIWDIGQFWPY